VPKKNYFTEQTRDVYFQTFKTYFEIDEKVELSKKKLTRKPSFNIHDAFSAVDIYKRGNLIAGDFKKYMERNGFHPTESEMIYLIARFDRNLNGVITY
jgi:Ca2+-binding EF-hand superfamily protein